MLGEFIQQFSLGKVTKLAGVAALQELPGGSVVVALSDPEALQRGELGKEIFFAIVSATPGHLIAQRATEEADETIRFEVQEFPAEGHLHYYTYDAENPTPAEVLQRAKSRLQQSMQELRSYPGDDFVVECLTGLDRLDIFAQKEALIGQHWWTPLEMSPRQVLDDLQASIEQRLANRPENETFFQRMRRKVADERLHILLKKIKSVTPRILLNLSTPQLEHHAILIEGGRCILFNTEGIRIVSRRSFCDTTPNTPVGGPAKGTPQGKEDYEARMVTRNRAVHRLCRASQHPDEVTRFNLIRNNSEHFCRECRNNEHACTQLRDKSIRMLEGVLSKLLPGWIAWPIRKILEDIFDLEPGEHAPMN